MIAVFLVLTIFLGGATLGVIAMVAMAIRKEDRALRGEAGAARKGKQFPGLWGLFSMMMGRVIRHGAGLAEGSLIAGAGWQAMRLAARLMPRAAGKRWLAEAASFLTEAPPALQRGAICSYLIGALPVIVVSWTATLARRTTITGVAPAPQVMPDADDHPQN